MADCRRNESLAKKIFIKYNLFVGNSSGKKPFEDKEKYGKYFSEAKQLEGFS